MFAEGESELRDLVVQNLESCGFLNKIKAELRAGVFLALSEEESLKKKVPLFNKKLDDFMNTIDGKLALSLVREFLEYFNLNFTLSVFDPEVSSSSPFANREKLCEDLNLNDLELEGPILSALFKKQETTKLCDLNPEKNILLEKKSEDLVDTNSVNEKSILNSFQRNTEQKTDFFEEKNETNKSKKLIDGDSYSTNKASNNRNFFNFSKPEEKDIFKDQSIDPFFDDPVPSEKPNFLNLSSSGALNDQKISSNFLTSEKESVLNDPKKFSSAFLLSEKECTSVSHDRKNLSSVLLPSEKGGTSTLIDQKKVSSTFLSLDKGSLSSLRDLPSLTKQDNGKNKESLSITLGTDILSDAPDNVDTFKEDLAKTDVDPESNEEYSDRQINSEESIEEEIEEEFSAGLDDLLNSSLSLGDDATSDQTVSQASVVDGVDHIESCNTVN